VDIRERLRCDFADTLGFGGSCCDVLHGLPFVAGGKCGVSYNVYFGTPDPGSLVRYRQASQ
jgi:hypothetical protein